MSGVVLNTGTALQADAPAVAAQPSRLQRFLRALWRSRSGRFGAILLLLILLTTLGADLLPLADPVKRNLSLRYLPPVWLDKGQWAYPLGTDGQGRDMLARIIYGARSSVMVGLAAVALSGAVGVAIGVLAGLRGGWLDQVLMRVVDAILAIPAMLFMLVVALVAGAGLAPLIVVIALTNWVIYTRIARAEVLRVKELEFVAAARVSRVRTSRLLLRHILPNILPALVVVATLNIGTVILTESSLSFLGFGIQPPDISWGQMLADGRQQLATSWWISTFPGVALKATVFSIILLGDWLRDYLDPRLP
ncbi:ABC transporter permease [Comamonas sp. JUb58]|uniref:ABC transporter permease n=1 Tax=Comamonas sp. JUb58 TaxID=2485114 RepID=UPI00105D4AC2|nr:ABC transporter permease [Comamonas sp. JUb58]TDS82247.1 peptide/nickel transport system permease protein [Comamonas sp. JUb58]